MDGNPWAKQFQIPPQQPSAMPAPDMKQAGKVPQTTPSPFPQSGFAKQGMVPGKSKMPQPSPFDG